MINEFSILDGVKYFSEIFCNYLVFTPVKKYIKYIGGTTRISSWKFNGMSEENIKKITKSNSNSAPPFIDLYLLPDIDFNWNFLINDNISKYIFRDRNIYLEIYKYISINIYLEILILIQKNKRIVSTT